ncbi:MAG: hypothetical protein HGA87_05240 [Desulfobulbaceae bacterium]|nr:hypothetical protein [Desulfobulbaceae bacterium]
MAVADLNKQRDFGYWGPIGRFGWKHRGHGGSPLKCILEEAKTMGQKWEPIQAGLFGGSLERLNAIADDYQNEVARSRY